MSQSVGRSFASTLPPIDTCPHHAISLPPIFFLPTKTKTGFNSMPRKTNQLFHSSIDRTFPYNTPIIPSFPSIYDNNQIKSYQKIPSREASINTTLINLLFPYTTSNFQIISSDRCGQGLIIHASRFAFGSCGFELFLQSLPSDQVCEACFFKLCPRCRRGCQ